MSDESNKGSDEESKPICPICGRVYEFKRHEKNTSSVELRSDATACKSNYIGGGSQVYIHFPEGNDAF